MVGEWIPGIFYYPSGTITTQAAPDEIRYEPELRGQGNESPGKQLVPYNLNVIML